MTRLAELDDFPKAGISAGSYATVVLWFNSAIQVICLLSFSAFGDFGPYRKKLLVVLTGTGSLFVFLHVICFSPGTWWVAGIFRIIAGQAFILSNVYYNAYLPVLVENHYDVLKQDENQRAKRQIEVSDEMSSKGYLIGYSGGVIMQIIVYAFLRSVECEMVTEDDQDRRLLVGPPENNTTSECSEFNQLFWLALSSSIVGLWWAGFSIITFRLVKRRAGPELPKDGSIYCLGWKQAWESIRMISKSRPLLLFVIAYFLWSDALATFQNAVILTLDSVSSRDSTVMLNAILSIVGTFIGLLIVSKVQTCFGISNKAILLFELLLLTISSFAATFGLIEEAGFVLYLVTGPVVLVMGSLQANSRSLFASFVPVGFEASMFAFFAITDKGSSLLGLGVISLVHSTTDEYRGVFWYTLLTFVVSAGILWFVDVQKGFALAGKTSGTGDS